MITPQEAARISEQNIEKNERLLRGIEYVERGIEKAAAKGEREFMIGYTDNTDKELVDHFRRLGWNIDVHSEYSCGIRQHPGYYMSW